MGRVLAVVSQKGGVGKTTTSAAIALGMAARGLKVCVVTIDPAKRLAVIRQAEAIMEQDPPVLPIGWEKINDVWYNYVKGHVPYEYFGIYDCVRFDTFWLDK